MSAPARQVAELQHPVHGAADAGAVAATLPRRQLDVDRTLVEAGVVDLVALAGTGEFLRQPGRGDAGATRRGGEHPVALGGPGVVVGPIDGAEARSTGRGHPSQLDIGAAGRPTSARRRRLPTAARPRSAAPSRRSRRCSSSAHHGAATRPGGRRRGCTRRTAGGVARRRPSARRSAAAPRTRRRRRDRRASRCRSPTPRRW